MIIKCDGCPYKKYCIARLNDTSITGCGMAFYMAGLIERHEIQVEHTIKIADQEENNDN